MSKRIGRYAAVCAAALMLAGCSSSHAAGPSASSPTTPTSDTSASSSADASATLTTVSLQPSDAAVGYTFTPYRDGDVVDGQVSLDLCSAHFASEAQRLARHQVAIRDTSNHGVVSSEALLYRPGAAAEAMNELRSALGACPTTPTKSDVAGAPALSYKVHPAPDQAWQQVPGVNRLATAMTATAQTGQSQEFMAVYLQRGRLLLAIYLQQPDKVTAALEGHPTIEDLTGRMATAIAALPDSAVE